MKRGREARWPTQIPGAGWLDIGWRVYERTVRDQLYLIAAGVAFFAVLALFPAITALVAIGGLIMSEDQIIAQITDYRGIVPDDVLNIISDQANAVAGTHDDFLEFAIVVGLLFALWSSSRGVSALVAGLNVVYAEEETRSIIWLNVRVLVLTLLLIFGFLVGLVVIVAIPVFTSIVYLGGLGEALARYGRWVILGGMTILGLGVLFRYGPDRSNARWSWLSAGTVFATLGWLVASYGFNLYVSGFANYNESFGALGGVMVLLMWLWISAFVVLIGGEINAEMEHQTRRDTTTGPEKPMGERGAVMADTLGPALGEHEDSDPGGPKVLQAASDKDQQSGPRRDGT